MSNVVPFERKEKTPSTKSSDDQQYDFAEIQKRNEEKKKRIAEERNDNNKSITRYMAR